MFTLNGTYGEVAALLSGLVFSQLNSDESDEDFNTFNYFVNSRLLVPSKFHWAGAIRMVTADATDAINRLCELFCEFVVLSESRTNSEIRIQCEAQLACYEAPPPVDTWRAFMSARFHADQHGIEDLILPNPDSAVLWRNGCANPEIAEQLILLSELSLVSIGSGTVDSGKVQLITELGKIDAFLFDGVWRIDASPIIQMDKANA